MQQCALESAIDVAVIEVNVRDPESLRNARDLLDARIPELKPTDGSSLASQISDRWEELPEQPAAVLTEVDPCLVMLHC